MRQLHRAGRERIWLSLALFLLAATVVLLIVVAGADPLQAMKGLLDGAFGDRYAIAETSSNRCRLPSSRSALRLLCAPAFFRWARRASLRSAP